MIRSFRDSTTKAVFGGGVLKGFPQKILKVARRKLEMLNAATRLSDLAVPPANRLEPMKKDRVGQHSIRINDQWRVCFVWTKDGPENVEIVDYHD